MKSTIQGDIFTSIITSLKPIPGLKEGYIYNTDEVEDYIPEREDLIGVYDQICDQYKLDTDELDPYDLMFRYELVDNKKLTKHIKKIQKFLSSKSDRKRIDKIKKSKMKLYPSFTMENSNFIFMEGFHRLVAYYEKGLKKFPIFFVSFEGM
jgi:hypothetical protein